MVWIKETCHGSTGEDRQRSRVDILRDPKAIIPSDLKCYPYAINYGPGPELASFTCVALLNPQKPIDMQGKISRLHLVPESNVRIST